MLHAAAMLTGLWIVWLLLTQRWDSALDLGVGAGAALLCVGLALRGGGAGEAFARLPSSLLLAVSRIGPLLQGAFATVRAAIAADVTLKPALVRVKTRARKGEERAAFASMISATPGMAVVDADADGMLVHVLNEDEVDAVDLGALEARVIGGGG